MQEYYKVTGKFYYRQLPKADVRAIVAGLVLFLSILLPVVQYQKWKRATDFLRFAATSNLSLQAGGTKATMELHRRAVEAYEARVAESNKGSKDREKLKPSRMMKDPEFIHIVDQVCIYLGVCVSTCVCVCLAAGLHVEGGEDASVLLCSI